MLLVSVTYPLDLTKTRLQIQGEVNVGGTTVTHAKRGMLKILYGIGEYKFKSQVNCLRTRDENTVKLQWLEHLWDHEN